MLPFPRPAQELSTCQHAARRGDTTFKLDIKARGKRKKEWAESSKERAESREQKVDCFSFATKKGQKEV